MIQLQKKKVKRLVPHILRKQATQMESPVKLIRHIYQGLKVKHHEIKNKCEKLADLFLFGRQVLTRQKVIA